MNKLVCVKQSILEGLHAFSYDHRNQLVGAVYPDGSSEGFAYDLVGNRTSLVAVSTNGATNTTYYTYASGNRLVADASETATNTYAYDGAGCLTNHVVNGQTRTFAYNFQGRMTSLTDIDGSVFAYEFDGEGNRLSQSLNDCLSKRFVYDGADVLLELNPTNGVAYAWVNGPGIDQPIERLLFIDGTPRARRVFHADALGSIAALTDPGGAVVQTYAYAVFGVIRSQPGPDPNRVTYTAREHLGDSQGWMYYRHRVYHPRIGRFTSTDPLGFIDGGNRFIYVHNHPNDSTDALGLLDWWWPFNGRVIVLDYNGSTIIIQTIDYDKKTLCELSPGQSTPWFQDFDFVGINGVWYKIGMANYKVKFNKNGNPIPCEGFEEVNERDKGWIEWFLKTNEQSKGAP